MGDAVVDSDNRLAPELGEDADDNGGDLERSAHSGALGVAEAVNVIWGNLCCFEGGFDKGKDVLEVVVGSLSRKETVTGRGDVGVARVGEDCAVKGYYSYAYLVC